MTSEQTDTTADLGPFPFSGVLTTTGEAEVIKAADVEKDSAKKKES